VDPSCESFKEDCPELQQEKSEQMKNRECPGRGYMSKEAFLAHSSRSRRAIALITVLLLTSLLLLLGLTFLTFVETDYRFAAQEDRRQQAYYLALAGLEYQRHRTDLLHPQVGGPISVRKALPESSLTESFEVTVYPDGSVISKGSVRNTFRELAYFKLLIPPGQSLMEARSIP